MRVFTETLAKIFDGFPRLSQEHFACSSLKLLITDGSSTSSVGTPIIEATAKRRAPRRYVDDLSSTDEIPVTNKEISECSL